MMPHVTRATRYGFTQRDVMIVIYYDERYYVDALRC